MANPRNYPGLADNEADIPRASNAMRDAISTDVQALADGGLGGGGVPGGVATTTNVAANNTAWTDSGVTLTGEDGLILKASGTIAHDAMVTPYGPLHSGGAYLVWALITDGSTPAGDVSGQFDYRSQRTAYRQAGRVWYRIRDVGGSGDNTGSFSVDAHYFADPAPAVAPLGAAPTGGGTPGPAGTNGVNGFNGWAPLLAVVTDGTRRVHRVVDWTGGTGTKPATGSYLGAAGYVTTAAEANDIRGAAGADGTGGGSAAQVPSGGRITPFDGALPYSYGNNFLESGVGVAGAVYYFEFEIRTAIKIASASWIHGSPGGGGSNSDFFTTGIYSMSGDKIVDTTPTTVISDAAPVATPTLLLPGRYYHVHSMQTTGTRAVSRSLDYYYSSARVNSSAPLRIGSAANSADASGVLPPTLGALSGTNSTIWFPLVAYFAE